MRNILTFTFGLALLVVGQPGLNGVLSEAAGRFQQLRHDGQPPKETDSFVQYLADRDRRLGGAPEMLEAEARYLRMLGYLQESNAVFARIPDNDLSTPEDISTRLSTEYVTDPSRALVLALRLSSSSDALSRDYFVHWLHNGLARELVPVPSAHFLEARWLVNALSSSDNQVAQTAVAALRIWTIAETSQDDSRVRALLDEQFSDPMSYGPRYELLLLDKVEQRSSDLELLGELNRRRESLVASLHQLLIAESGRLSPSRSDRLCYWIAYGRTREWDLARRLPGTNSRQLLELLSDAALSSLRVDPPSDAWLDEEHAMGGRREYLTPAADQAELLGRLDAALQYRVNATNLDSRQRTSLEATYARAGLPEPFDAFWSRERFKNARMGPSWTGATGRTWRVLKLWSSVCAPCIADLRDLASLSKRFPGRVAIFDPEEPAIAAANYITVRNLVIPIDSFNPSQSSKLVSNGAPRTLVFNPDNRYIVLDESRWFIDSAYWLSH